MSDWGRVVLRCAPRVDADGPRALRWTDVYTDPAAHTGVEIDAREPVSVERERATRERAGVDACLAGLSLMGEAGGFVDDGHAHGDIDLRDGAEGVSGTDAGADHAEITGHRPWVELGHPGKGPRLWGCGDDRVIGAGHDAAAAFDAVFNEGRFVACARRAQGWNSWGSDVHRDGLACPFLGGRSGLPPKARDDSFWTPGKEYPTARIE